MEYGPSGAFMIVAGIAQLAWAVAIVRAPSSAFLARAGVLGNGSIILLWIVSRTVGLPVGPQRGMPEHVHGPDLLATGLEAIVLIAAIMLLYQQDRGGRLLLAASKAGVVFTMAVSAHDASREATIAIATFALIAAMRAVITVSPDLFTSVWRRHETIALARHGRPRLAVPARAGFGAGG